MKRVLYVLGGVLMVAGACLFVTRLAVSPYLYLAGAVLFGWAQVTDKTADDTLVVRRLRRQQLIAAFLLVVAGVLMLTLRHNEWVVCLLVAAVIELYTSFRLSREMERK